MRCYWIGGGRGLFLKCKVFLILVFFMYLVIFENNFLNINGFM